MMWVLWPSTFNADEGQKGLARLDARRACIRRAAHATSACRIGQLMHKGCFLDDPRFADAIGTKIVVIRGGVIDTYPRI